MQVRSRDLDITDSQAGASGASRASARSTSDATPPAGFKRPNVR